MTTSRNPLRLNVGFILHEEVGSSHEFDFDLPEYQLGADLEVRQLVGHLTIGRTAQGLLFTGEFYAETDLACVRCLSPYAQLLKWTFTELYSMNERSLSESGLLVPEDAQIDIGPLLREYALLEVPINPICRPDCRGLCPVCGEDLNIRDCGHRPDAGPSPFGVLRDFIH
ncbi:MAG TPA: DUF177 domain-containing protein [Anaerolineales bacterium]|nr:DUF177 domain-containing protein [Anaerolineales bacterium]